MIWAFIYSNLIGNSIGLNICGMWVTQFFLENETAPRARGVWGRGHTVFPRE
jgi:hypothetical protein